MGKYDSIVEEAIHRLKLGQSYGMIASDLNLNKGTLHKIVAKQRRNAGEEGNVVRPRERKFVKGLIQGLSQTEAARQAGVPAGHARTWGTRAMRRERVLNDFERMLAKTGLTEEHLAQRHFEALAATKTTVLSHKGQMRKLETPDHPTRLRAVELGWDLFGRREQVMLSSSEVNVLIGIPHMAVSAAAAPIDLISEAEGDSNSENSE